MKRDFLKLKLPEKYMENIIEYELALDGVPEWPEFAGAGWSMEEYFKFMKLHSIEKAKYHLAEAIEDGEVTDEEKVEADKMIQEIIQEYNAM